MQILIKNNNYNLILFFLFILSCSCVNKKQDSIKTKILCIPNRMTTYNMSLLTFEKEYEKYGLKIDVDNLNFENELYELLDTINTKMSSRNGLRIKIITTKKDSVYMSYLPNSSFIYNDKNLKNNRLLLNLVVNEIKENYKKGNYICEGEKCSENPDEKNVKFLEVMSNNISD
ncbi:hypothetical protein TPENAI_60315 [Tenacibaculum litopenaei]|uniref:hypothetical protein n=1 Tax=Tenacibaculum litopenaei TaxID=396016 RepID=UPI003893923C